MTEGNGNGHNRMPDMIPSPRAIELDKIADELGLTEQQKRFAIEYVSNPEPGYKDALRRAGCTARNLKSIASMYARHPKVVAYIEAIRAIVLAKPDPPKVPSNVTMPANAPSVYRIDKGLANADEVWRGATRIMRQARVGAFIDEKGAVILEKVRKAYAGVIRRYEVTERWIPVKDGEDIREVTTKFEVADGIAIHALMAKITGLEKAPKREKRAPSLMGILRKTLSVEQLKQVQSAIAAEQKQLPEGPKP